MVAGVDDAADLLGRNASSSITAFAAAARASTIGRRLGAMRATYSSTPGGTRMTTSPTAGSWSSCCADGRS